MISIKEAVLESIKDLPDECSPEDMMYEIYVISQVFQGLQDAQEGKTISTEELLQRVKSWAK
jgi:predicted transcriptional regulator